SRERQTDRKYQPVFVDAEPPPSAISDADLRMDAGERRLRLTETDDDDADRNQHEPDRDHQDGVIVPMNWDGHSQKFKMHFRRNVCWNSGHSPLRRFLRTLNFAPRCARQLQY